MQIRLLAATLVLALASALSPAGAQNLITFDTLPGMPNGSGQVVPAASRLSNQFAATLGVTFASQSSFVAVVNHGAATPSVPNIIGGTSATGTLRYLSPVYITFVDPANPALPATTDFVSVRGDKNAIAGTATMKIFAVDGTQLGSLTVPDIAGGLTLALNQPGIHKVELTQTSGTIGFDNLTFATVSPCSPVQRYCTAGTTTHGCVPSLTAAGLASASASSGFTLAVQGVEGQTQGVLLYGLSGPLAAQWGTGTSYLCVKSPTQRMPPTSSGGTAGQCNGVLSIDWCAFVSAYPGALGTPFTGGDVVYVQGWFRDPPAPKTTNLSDALEFTVSP